MPYSSFAEFGAALCAAAGVAAPVIAPDSTGLAAFHLVQGDVVSNFIHLDESGIDDVMLLITFGAVPEHLELDVLRMVSDANFSLLGAAAPVFGRNPATGEIVLRQSFSLGRDDAHDAYGTLLQLSQFARDWRADPLLGQIHDLPHGAGVALHRMV